MSTIVSNTVLGLFISVAYFEGHGTFRFVIYGSKAFTVNANQDLSGFLINITFDMNYPAI